MERYGTPLTEAERTARHFELTGETTTPIRGTRKRLATQQESQVFLGIILISAGLLIAEIWFANKQGWLNF